MVIVFGELLPVSTKFHGIDIALPTRPSWSFKEERFINLSRRLVGKANNVEYKIYLEWDNECGIFFSKMYPIEESLEEFFKKKELWKFNQNNRRRFNLPPL